MRAMYLKITKICLLAMIIPLAGCSLLNSASATPTVDAMAATGTVSAIQTESAQLVFSQLTQAALLTPSATIEVPTNTPQATNTTQPTVTEAVPPTATKTAYVAPAATNTPTQAALQCSVTALSPAYGMKVAANVDFDFSVTIKNTGTTTWGEDDINFGYLNGTKFQKKVDSVDLPKDIAAGASVSFLVDMFSGTATGAQSASWGLMLGGNGYTFCVVDVSVIVE